MAGRSERRHTGTLKRRVTVPDGSPLTAQDYRWFLATACEELMRHPQYLAAGEDVNALELAHLLPAVPETVIAIYVGINDAACNKGLVSPFLLRHGHNNVFAFDPAVYGGGRDVPSGTVDARAILTGFEPPNPSWPADWTYVMVADSRRTFRSLWKTKGYIDMVPAKFEDFTLLSDPAESRVCTFIHPSAFDHPVNKARAYLKAARRRGEREVRRFAVPAALKGETDGLVPVVLGRGEKLYVANPAFGPCEHAWSNLHPDNTRMAVINENSAVPLELVTAKPPVAARYARGLVPPKGSADMTTDWFFRGRDVCRLPLLAGAVKG